ncbi:MAG: hypothetical protein DRP51_05980, partial [Candidatus Zixiibacteriota bacterium]
MRRFTKITTLVTITIMSYFSGFAGTLSQELAEQVKVARQSDKIEVLILVKSSQTPFELRKELTSRYKTNAERHRVGIDRLRTESARSQKDLLELLSGYEASGLSRNTKGHWLINGITTEIAVSKLESLVRHPDVESIQTTPKIESIRPKKPEKTVSSLSLNLSTGVQPNLEVIGAPQAWAQGLTGKGTVVCSFDTGVDGLHPALF